jgi:REP element-mobilizing transposase RayT
MHLVLRSSKAKGAQSFLRPQNAKRIKSVVDKFSFIYGVQILSQANVGNHLHLHLRLGNRYGYKPFIRAITGAIAMAVSGRNRWTTSKSLTKESVSGSEQNVRAERFWDFRPFTRVVEGLRSILRLEDYVRINRLEAFGIERKRARVIVDRGKVAEIAIQ